MPNTSLGRIELAADLAGCTVRVDGQDISEACWGYTLSVAPGMVPQLRLDLMVYEVQADPGDCQIEIPKRTRDVLVKLGWTPPPSPGEASRG